jgi:hypothetical protein
MEHLQRLFDVGHQYHLEFDTEHHNRKFDVGNHPQNVEQYYQMMLNWRNGGLLSVKRLVKELLGK